MRPDTWRVRTTGDRWIAPARDDFDPNLRVSYDLYLILLELDDSSSVFNCGPLNTFVLGDAELCADVPAAPPSSGFQAVEFTSTSDYLTRALTLPSGATRAYGSLWVSLPAGDVDANMVVGFAVEDSSFTKNFVYFCALDPYRGPPTDFRHELKVTSAGATVPEVMYHPVSDATNERWIHILFQVDTTQSVMADRVKVWLGDTKVTSPFDNSDVGLNDTITLGTGPHNIYIGAQSTSAFGVHPATSKIAAAWVKFSSTSLFDFEVAADRRNFINASKQYVTHAASMGGQTADFWGAGDLSGWSGWTNSGGASASESGTLTSI